MVFCLRILALLLCLAISVTATVASPLFDEQSSLVLTIEAPMRNLIRERVDNPVHEAQVRYVDSAGQVRALPARITSRGNARLVTCDFPPLRLEFRKKDVDGTVFEGQDGLKLVTQCKNGRDGETWLLQEFGIYRAYNDVTDYSYRVRRLELTYVDSESSRWSRTQPAFFIEPTGELADRMRLDSVRPPTIEPQQFQQAELAKNMLFQVLIANTDFSIRRGPAGEGCCHNGRVLAEPGAHADWIIVPYDFDQAGIINTDYALVDRRLGIRAVTNRLYRGFCWQNDHLPETIELFRERRQAITTALIPSEVSPTRQKRVRRFIDGFYDILDDPAELQRRIVDKCRGESTILIRKTTASGR